MRNCRLTMSLLLATVAGFALPSSADQPTSETPILSLESLYHPEKSFDYDGKLPETRWIGKAPSRLLVQRNKQWMEFDLNSGRESEWPIATAISRNIMALGGLSEDQVQQATLDAVKGLSQLQDATIVQIDKSWAIVSAAAPARWLMRDGSVWGNVTLDSSGRRVGYTRDGDMFVVDVASGQTHRLTNDGSETILDGVLDWTYQEEIFGRGNYKGFWFSPDGQWLAMLRVDIGGIDPYTLSSSGDQRGLGIVRRYPKAGDPIPHASLWIWDLRQLDSGNLPAAKQVAQSTLEDQCIITGVWWCPTEIALVYSISDRTQSWRELRILNKSYFAGETNEATLLLREQSPTWIEPPADPAWIDDGSLVWRSELPTGRNRLYHIDVSGKVVTPVSPEEFHVRDFHVSGDRATALVVGNANQATADQYAYRIDLADPNQLKQVTKEPGWHHVDISPDGKSMVDQFSTARRPPELSLRRADPATESEIDRDQVIAESELKIQHPITIPIVPEIQTADGVDLPAMLVRPQSATDANPCPVVIEVYGGPQAPSVSNRWQGKRTLYRELLARRGIATLAIDSRSSAGRGSIDSWPIHQRVGETEFQDLMVGVQWLRQQPWVDSQRLAIRGWSFGGFLTLYAMTHSDAFTAGIAGGAVTDWREYDAFYTERYMGLPSENAAGYDATAPVGQADKIHGLALLIHGESDDNVHPAGTLRMAGALQQAGKDFRLMIYPGAGHGITNPQQIWHMTQMTDRFLIEQLAPK